MESSVINDLETIEKMVSDTIPSSYSNITFDGVMSLRDFACFVYFEYCATVFVNNEKTESLNRHQHNLQNLYMKKSLTEENSENSDNNYIAEWLTERNDESYVRMLTRNIKDMISARYFPKFDDFDEHGDSPSKALTTIAEYRNAANKDKKEIRKGTPVGKCFFYQILADSVSKGSKRQLIKWLANYRTSTEDLICYYESTAKFLRLFMVDVYSNNMNEEQVETYLAKAVNIAKHERSKKLFLILDFAIAVHKQRPEYFDKLDEVYFRSSVLPPIFSNLLNYYIDDVQHFLLFRELYKIAIYPRPIHTKVNSISPVLHYKKYASFFLSADPVRRRNEEHKYQTILLLAENLKHRFLLNQNLLTYSPQKFAWFIHNHYNVFTLIRDDQEINSILTKDVAYFIHKIAGHLAP